VRSQGKGASLFGYTELYGSVPGGQAEYLRVPQAHFGPIKVPTVSRRALPLSVGHPAHRWQAFEFAEVPGRWHGGGVRPRTGRAADGPHRLRAGRRVIGVDRVPERLALAKAWGAEVVDLSDVSDVPAAILDLTDGRGADGTVDAVGMEAHGSPLAQAAIGAVGLLPDVVAKPLADRLAIDRLAALSNAIKSVRRGGTVSVSGVYGGEVSPLPLMEMFDRGISMRLGQCHVRRWTDDIISVLLEDADVLGVESLATHHLPLEEAPQGYDLFQKKADGCLKVVLQP
jgi:threonine dehydrogenase-like Zn-dependent dehydrogenase